MDWFIRHGTEVDGPFPEEDVRRRFDSGKLTRVSLIAPNKKDFHRLFEWAAFSAQGTLNATDFSKETSPKPHPDGSQMGGTQILGAPQAYMSAEFPNPAGSRTTKLSATSDQQPSAPFVAQGAPPMDGSQTTVLGSQAELPENEEDQHREEPETSWPGAQQSEPEAQQSEPEAKAAAPTAERPPVRPKRALNYAPPAKLPPVKSSLGLPQVLGAAAVVLLVGTAAAAGADRLLNGASSSNVSEFLPAGSAWYAEIPSIHRLIASASDVESINWEKLGDEPREALSRSLYADKTDDPTAKVVGSIESVAATSVGDALIAAFRHRDSPPMEAFLKTGKVKVGRKDDLGIRFTFADGQAQCLWRPADLVSLCAEEGGLVYAEDVLRGAAKSAATDPNWQQAKKRSWKSYLPFSDRPVFYAVATPSLSLGDQIPDFGGATVSASLGKAGLLEKLDVMLPRDGRAILDLPGALKFRDRLPMGTVMYANYRSTWPATEADLRGVLSGIDSLPAGAPSADALVEQAEAMLGMPMTELGTLFGPEGLFAATLKPGASLSTNPAQAMKHASFWYVQELSDEIKTKRMIQHLVDQLPPGALNLKWKTDTVLTGSGGQDLSFHLSIDEGALTLVTGGALEVARALDSGPRIGADGAHERAIAQVDDKASGLMWLDVGRFAKESRAQLASDRNAQRFAQALITEGDRRLTMAAGVRQFEQGPVRIRSLNFPTGLVALTLLQVAAKMGQHLPAAFGGDFTGPSPFQKDASPGGRPALPPQDPFPPPPVLPPAPPEPTRP